MTLSELEPDQVYVYRCGGPHSWSAPAAFLSRRSPEHLARDAVRLLIFGDMGVDNAQVNACACETQT